MSIINCEKCGAAYYDSDFESYFDNGTETICADCLNTTPPKIKPLTPSQYEVKHAKRSNNNK